MIEFIFEEDEKNRQPVFGDVEVDQFFVDRDNWLGQKTSTCSYNLIAMNDGSPAACDTLRANPDKPIKRVLPRVAKIKFPGVLEPDKDIF